MVDYRLYKGAWIGVDELKETRLTKAECRKLLKDGGFLSAMFTILILRKRLLFGMSLRITLEDWKNLLQVREGM